MASFEKKKWSLVMICLFIFSTFHQSDASEPQVPCFFIFGDSLADNGNNNNLITFAKVNYKPYGIDFSGGTTGRFTNGRTTVDILGELLGMKKTIQSFASSFTSKDLLSGVNYASGAAGILRISGKHMGENISFRRQVENHRKIVSIIGDKIGNKSLGIERLKKCLYWVGMGNNDYINNYFMPKIYPTSSRYSPEQFASLLIQKYRQQVLELYSYGARIVAFDGLGQIGCTPNAITTYGTNGSACVDFMNDAVQFFNKKLVELVDDLNTDFSDAKFVYINSFGSGSGEISLSTGFKVWDVGCCEVNNIGQCVRNKIPCQDRSEYVFWDSFHTTEAFNIITANKVYKAHDTSDSYPMDISHLVKFFGHSADNHLTTMAESTSIVATY